MTANTQPTETRAQTTNGSFQTDVSALQETTERAVEILDSHGEPVTIARLVGTVVRLGARDEYLEIGRASCRERVSSVV